MLTLNDTIVIGCALVIFLGALRFSPRLWNKKGTVFVVLCIFLFIWVGVAYGAYLWRDYFQHPPIVHEWIDGDSTDLQGKQLDPALYK